MKIEIIHGRTMLFMIDGQRPVEAFSVIENAYGGYEFRDLVIAGLSITGMNYEIAVEDIEEGDDPTMLFIHTSERGVISLNVVGVVNGDDNDEREIMLGDGTTRAIDSTEFYVVAEI